MALTTLVSAVDGDNGASSGVRVGAGHIFWQVTGTDFTGVTVAFQFSDDNSTFVTLDSESAAGGGVLTVPDGYIRTNITGGGSGDAITVSYKQFRQDDGDYLSAANGITVAAS